MPDPSEPQSSASDVSKAVELLKRTLPEMNRRHIATTPENYAVWYEYVSGENPGLNEAIDTLEHNRVPLTDEIHQDLYNNHVASTREAAVNKLSDNVRHVINDLLGKIGSEGNGLCQYSASLNQLQGKVNDHSDAAEIRGLIAHLLDETQKRENATRQMQDNLQSMTDELKKLRSEITRLNSEASTDALTKVNNRRAFDIELDNLISAAKMEQTSLCLLLIDIDHFKRFNDKFGHIIGDKVLRFVATLLKRSVKGSDVVSRFGGEEFAVLLPETDYKGAITVAENIREQLAKQSLSDSTEKMQLGSITISVGVACYNYGEFSEEFMHRADLCMYEAKRQGRNCVVGEQAMPTPEHSTKTFL